MKTTAVLLAITFLGGSGLAEAVTPLSDKFNKTLNTKRWASVIEASGRIGLANKKVEFTVPSKPTDDDYALFKLRGIQPKYNEDWEVLIDVTNKSAKGDSSGAVLIIENAADRDDAVFIELYGRPSSGSRVNTIFMTNGDDDWTQDIGKNIKGTKATLRATYKQKSKVITFWYRASATAAWTKVSTFSPADGGNAQRRGNWGMKAKTGKFNIMIGGFADGTRISPGQITLDNFVIR